MGRPNILLITSDQQHYDTLGFANPRIKTPALDRLAREGTNCTRAYCNNPTCTPSRATIITGMYPSVHGAWSLGTKLSEDVPTVGDVFQKNGYATSLVGKAHFHPLVSREPWTSIECQPTLRDLKFWDGFRGPWYGFQRVETARMHTEEHMVGGHYAIWMEQRGLKNWRDFFMPWPVPPDVKRRYGAWELPQEYHYSVWTADKTIEFMRDYVRENKPFFAWSSFHDPHPSYLVPQPWASMYDPGDMVIDRPYVPGEFDDKPPHFGMTRDKNARWEIYRETPAGNHGFHYQVRDEADLRKDMAIYYGMVSFMDQQIGRILAALDELGIAENTLIVFTTDHGHFLGQHGLYAKAAHLYEDMVRLPWLVRWPGRVPAGATCDALQSLIDLPETFLQAAGVEIPGVMQGVSRLDLWCGKALKEASGGTSGGTSGDISGDISGGVIVEHRHQPTVFHVRSYITRRYKLTVYRDREYGELYDLERDPGERKNHWSDPAYAGVKAELFRGFVNALLRAESLPMPRIAGA